MTLSFILKMQLCFKKYGALSNFMLTVGVLSKHKNMALEDQQNIFALG